MTSENEKKEENETLALFKKNYEDEKALLEEVRAQGEKQINRIDARLGVTKDTKEADVLWDRRRLIFTGMALVSTSVILHGQDYTLAIMITQLQDKMEGLKPNLSLEETAKQLENDIRKIADEQLAKRIDQMQGDAKASDAYIG